MEAPEHLKAARALWEAVAAAYVLEPHHFRLLTLACEASDRCDEARAALEADGLFIRDRFGAIKPHPAAAIERDSRLAAARMLRELNLDSDKAEESRPPALRYLKGGG
jgi:phage terminase small subunit